jgi:hypothetical protein
VKDHTSHELKDYTDHSYSVQTDAPSPQPPDAQLGGHPLKQKELSNQPRIEQHDREPMPALIEERLCDDTYGPSYVNSVLPPDFASKDVLQT